MNRKINIMLEEIINRSGACGEQLPLAQCVGIAEGHLTRSCWFLCRWEGETGLENSSSLLDSLTQRMRIKQFIIKDRPDGHHRLVLALLPTWFSKNIESRFKEYKGATLPPATTQWMASSVEDFFQMASPLSPPTPRPSWSGAVMSHRLSVHGHRLPQAERPRVTSGPVGPVTTQRSVWVCTWAPAGDPHPLLKTRVQGRGHSPGVLHRRDQLSSRRIASLSAPLWRRSPDTACALLSLGWWVAPEMTTW